MKAANINNRIGLLNGADHKKVTKLPSSPHGPSGRLLGYARVSTEDQATDAQTGELRAASLHDDFSGAGPAPHAHGQNLPG